MLLCILSLWCCHAAGDSLFRVVKRLPLPAAPDGSQRVEVVNKAAIRVLAWKIWTSNRVVYQISPRKAAKQSQESSKSEDAAEECNNSSGNPGARTVSFKLLSSVSGYKVNSFRQLLTCSSNWYMLSQNVRIIRNMPTRCCAFKRGVHP